ncbi:MAG: sulfite exporter TauE/SafE family protein [Candidatus Competibacteraceae bacterium]
MMSLLFGIIVGFSLGLTGGGGSIFAVPLLVYGLAVPVHQAVVVSLAAVGSMALAGAVTHLHSGAAEWQTGTLFGLAGIVGAPVGAWVGAQLPGVWLLCGFALLMLLVAMRLWRQATFNPAQARIVRVLGVQSPTPGLNLNCQSNRGVRQPINPAIPGGCFRRV